MPETPRLIAWAAGLSLVGALIHATVMDSHFEEWWGYGLFFLVASMAQGVYAGALVFPRILHGEPVTKLWPRSGRLAFYWVGIGGNLAIMTLWAITRTVGIPFFGPEAGEVERVGIVDGVSKVVEAALVVVLVVLVRHVPPAGAATRRPA